MKKENYSILVIVLRAVAGLLGLIAFLIIFTDNQMFLYGSLNFKSAEIISPNPATNYNGTVLPLIGYILAGVAGLGSIAMIFCNKFLGEKKTVKLVDYILGGVLVLAGLLVVLTVVWFGLANGNSAGTKELTLGSSPVTSLVLAVIAGALNIVTGAVLEDRI